MAPLLLFCLSAIAPAGAADRASCDVTIELSLAGRALDAFRLFHPVHEAEWDPDWRPHMLSGSVFTTGSEEDPEVWLLAQYELPTLHIQYASVKPGKTASLIDISVVALGGARSRASVRYRRTSLSPPADASVTSFAVHFPHQGPHWERALNGALARAQGE
jgi:hypothetical protein